LIFLKLPVLCDEEKSGDFRLLVRNLLEEGGRELHPQPAIRGSEVWP
jgi:hypothetical protein